MLDRDPLPSSSSIEELSSAHLEIDDDDDGDAEDAVDVTATAQGMPTPFVPEAPKTSPVLVAPPAPAPAPVQEDQASFTQPFRRELHGPAPLAEERANFTQPFRRPSSIAPVAIDVAPVRPAPARPDTTLPIAAMSARQAETVITRLPPPKLNIVPWVIAASIIGLFLAGGGIVATVASSSPSSASSHAASIDKATGSAPRTAEVTAAKTSQTVEPVTASSIGAHGEKVTFPTPTFATNGEPVSVNALPTVSPAPAAAPVSTGTTRPAPRTSTSTTTTTSPTTTSTPSTKTAAPAAPAPAAAAPEPAPVAVAPRPARPAPTTGVVLVPPPLVVVVVDGQHRRVVDGKVVLACGAHKIRAGVGDTRVVDVPCGGTLSL